MDNLPPGPCPNCGKAAKPLFNSYYCDCDKEAQSTKCIHGKPQYEGALPTCEDCRVDFYPATPSSAKIIVNGVQMTHWLECTLCAGPVLYIDHDPLTRPGEVISEANGYHQYNYVSVNGSALVCDSCGKMVSIHNFQQRYLHKY